MSHLGPESIQSMERFFDFATVPPNRDVIRQDEYGNFMVVLLSGSIAVDRVQPWGERLRLAETRPGEILGEMSLLDSGIRFSACTTMNECEVAALGAEAMDDMLSANPPLAANLIALLARKLSLRLRMVSARLSEKK
jgi:CRP-like cAMP-binding protein